MQLLQKISIQAVGTTLGVTLGNAAGNGTVNITQGSLLVAYVASYNGGRTASASDNVNGPYNTDIGGSATATGAICTFPNSQPGQITVIGAMSGSSATFGMIVEEWGGVAPLTPLDQTSQANASGVTSGNTGTTPALAQAGELALTLCILNSGSGATYNVTAPFTPDPLCPFTLGSQQVFMAANNVQSTTAGVQANFTWTNSVGYRAMVATYKALPTYYLSGMIEF